MRTGVRGMRELLVWSASEARCLRVASVEIDGAGVGGEAGELVAAEPKRPLHHSRIVIDAVGRPRGDVGTRERLSPKRAAPPVARETLLRSKPIAASASGGLARGAGFAAGASGGLARGAGLAAGASGGLTRGKPLAPAANAATATRGPFAWRASESGCKGDGSTADAKAISAGTMASVSHAIAIGGHGNAVPLHAHPAADRRGSTHLPPPSSVVPASCSASG